MKNGPHVSDISLAFSSYCRAFALWFLLLFQTDRFDQDWGIITAGAVMAALPIVLIYLPLQKYVIGGLTAGSVKG